MYYGSVSFWWRLNFQGTPGYVGYSNQYGSILNHNGVGIIGTALLVAYVLLEQFFQKAGCVEVSIFTENPRQIFLREIGLGRSNGYSLSILLISR